MNDKEDDRVKAPLQGGMPSWRIILWLAVLWALAILFFRGGDGGSAGMQELAYSEFKSQVAQGNVEQVTIGEEVIEGTLKTESENGAGNQEQNGEADAQGQQAPNGASFRTVRPQVEDAELMPLLEANEVAIMGESQPYEWLWQVLILLLPWILIIGFFVYMGNRYRKMAGGEGPGGGIFGFAKSKAKRVESSKISKKYNDIAGLDNAKKELEEVVEFLRDPSRFTALGGELPKGILLIGPPGVGKTLLAQATAGEAGVPFFSISGSEFIEMFVGVGASRVRDMFDKAKKQAPAIIFIDELDSIGRTRGAGMGGGHDEREQTLNQILAEMDGFSPRENIVVLAATNRPDVLDQALVRPGRFDRRITLDRPQKEARKAILKIHLRNKPVADDVDAGRVALQTVGFTGADLRNLANEAALLAARKKKQQIEMEDIQQAKDKIIMGIRREEVIQEEEKRAIAYHESGHALVAKLLPGADPLNKVTIIPRGSALGATEQTPEEDRYHLRKTYLLNRIAILLGGRAAENLVFDDVSTGAADDLKKATSMARRMVCQWGMSERLGPVTFKSGEPHPFLGKELNEPRDFSEQTAAVIDEEIRTIVDQMEKRAFDVLKTNRETLDSLAERLLDQETLTPQEIEEIVGRQTSN